MAWIAVVVSGLVCSAVVAAHRPTIKDTHSISHPLLSGGGSRGTHYLTHPFGYFHAHSHSVDYRPSPRFNHVPEKYTVHYPSRRPESSYQPAYPSYQSYSPYHYQDYHVPVPIYNPFMKRGESYRAGSFETAAPVEKVSYLVRPSLKQEEFGSYPREIAAELPEREEESVAETGQAVDEYVHEPQLVTDTKYVPEVVYVPEVEPVTTEVEEIADVEPVMEEVEMVPEPKSVETEAAVEPVEVEPVEVEPVEVEPVAVEPVEVESVEVEPVAEVEPEPEPEELEPSAEVEMAENVEPAEPIAEPEFEAEPVVESVYEAEVPVEADAMMPEEEEPVAEVEAMDEATQPQVEEDTKSISTFTGGYAQNAPMVLSESPFCEGKDDGNYRNPGLIENALPECTYITCAGKIPVLFNCAPGTFHGTSDSDTFCAQLDFGTEEEDPVCRKVYKLEMSVYDDSNAPEAEVEQPSVDDSLEIANEETDEMPEESNADEMPEEPRAYPIPEPPTNDEVEVSVEKSQEVQASTESVPISPSDVEEDTSIEFEKPTPKEASIDKYSSPLKLPTIPMDGTTTVSIKAAPLPSQTLPDFDSAVEAKTESPAKPEGKSFYVEQTRNKDYTAYKYGYGSGPKALDIDFCVNMQDGNYANPGISRDADPRCSYIVCASERTFIFNCPLGTFNGNNYAHHFQNIGAATYAHAYHYRYPGSGFCGTGDLEGLCSA